MKSVGYRFTGLYFLFWLCATVSLTAYGDENGDESGDNRGELAFSSNVNTLATPLSSASAIASLNSALTSNEFPSSGDDFLAIEQAYQLFPRQENNHLLLQWVLAPGYYLYQNRFRVQALNADNTASQQPLSPQFLPGSQKYDDYYEKELEVYYQGTTVTVPLPAGHGKRHFKIESQACADAGLCYPPRSQYVSLDANRLATVSPQPPAAVLTTATSISSPQATDSVWLILLFALLGGMILNLMPCVLPVLSIKVLSLSSNHGGNQRQHGLAYTAGVISTFVGVALLLMALRAGGEALGWGFQLQSPAFICVLIVLFFVMGLSFSGFFEAGARLMNLGQTSAANGSTLRHSFITGILATVVASPCSAPFMGTALGFALTQPASTALWIFAALGLGMALPFLALTWSPALLRFLPKPGQWMVTLKEFLAFPLYLTCIWLLWILGHQRQGEMVIVVLISLVCITLAIWLVAQGSLFAKTLAAIVLAAALYLPTAELSHTPTKPLWQPYSQQKLDNLLAQRQAVFINLTADWCITCLANEKLVLASDTFSQTLANNNITYLKGDWTQQDPEITHLLNSNGRNGVPLYLFYPAGAQQAIILPQILSQKVIDKHLP